MRVLSRSDVIGATQPSRWDATERVLYALCRRYPHHRDQGATLAKVLLIGRSNAAAIERRKNKAEDNRDFYEGVVEPTIRRSSLDRWLDSARAVRPASQRGFDVLVDVHAKTTALFNRISGLSKRSLASKYLHFHIPRLFYIFDSRAYDGLRSLNAIVAGPSLGRDSADAVYERFAERCRRLVEYCFVTFGVRLSPRAIDRLLLTRGKK